MTESQRPAGVTFDAELDRRLEQARWTRREFLARVSALGAAAALTQLIAACGGSVASPTAAPATPASTPAPAGTTGPVATAAPTPVPTPESELFIYNWTDYLAQEVIDSFEAQFGVKVRQDFFTNTEEAYAKLGDDGGGYDISFPINVDVPNFVARGALLELDKSLLPNIVNLGSEWANPLYDPGNRYTVPYMWWTTGVGYDTGRISDELTSSKALWDTRWKKHILMLDDYQEAFAMALIQLGHSANSQVLSEIDEAFELLKAQAPLVRDYDTDTITQMTSGDMWIGQIWGADRFAIQEVNENVVYYIPEEGSVKGSDTLAIFSGAKHPIAAHLFINHLLDAQNSAANTNLIYYMGPNEAAKQYIQQDILEDPAVNPAKEIVAKLEELIDQPQDIKDYYLDKWRQVKLAG